ncbi:MAG: hypothetical protein H6807_09110 [Planctomycetes bacterium]|nr:hypothetical protein [Planctomycetota bacterium]
MTATGVRSGAYRLGGTLLFLGLVLVVDFLFLFRDPVPPILNDDWAIHADLVWGRARPAITVIREMALMSWEARPLRAIEYGLQLAAERALGPRGPFLLQALILALGAQVFASLVGRRLGALTGLLAGALLLLHPGDTTHVWLATMMAKLALLYVLLALLAFARGRDRVAGLLLLASFGSYELAPFAFALAPWVADGGSRASLRRGLRVFMTVLALYLGWRLAVFSVAAPELRLGSDAGGGLGALGRGLLSVWPASFGPGLLRGRPTAPVLLGLAAAFALALLFGSRRLALETDRRPLLRALGFGLLATLAGAALSFAARPTPEPGIASRHLIGALPGAALVLACLPGLVGSSLGGGRAARGAALIATALLLAQATGGRLEARDDYREAARWQRRMLHEMITALGPLPPHSLVVIDRPLEGWPPPGSRPADRRAIDPLVTGLPHEIEAILGLVYDRSIVGIARQDARDDFRARQATASQIRAEEPPFHSVVVWSVPERRASWLRRLPLDPGETMVAPSGPAWDYLGR